MKFKTKYTSHIILLIVMLACYSFLTSTELGSGVQTQTLPTLYRLADSSYLPNDWYINETYKFDVRYFYNHLILQVNKLFNNLEWTVLFLHVLSFVFFHLSIFLLANILLKNKEKALFTTLIIFIGYPISLGSTSFFKGNLSPNGIGWALIILALYFYFKDKYLSSFFIMGLASLVDFGDALPISGILLGNIILSKPLFSKEKIINLLSSIPFFLLSSLIIVPLYITNKTTPFLAKFSAEIIANNIYKHISPFSWKILDVLPFILLFFYFIIIFKRTNIKAKYKRSIKNIVWICIIICIIGTIFVEIYPVATIVKLHLFKVTKIITLFSYLFIGSYFYTIIKQTNNWIEKLFYISFPLTFLYPILLIPAIPIISIITLLENKKRYNIFNYFQQKKIRIAVLVVILIGFLLFFGKILITILPAERTTINALLPYIILPGTLYIIFLLLLNIKLVNARIIAVLIIILLTITIGPFNPLLHIQSDSEDSKLFSYIQEHTSEKEIFLIPVHLRKFRTSTNRPVVIDISFPFTDTGNIRWYLIIKDISNNYINEPQQLKDKNRINEGYHSLTKKKLIELKEKYKFDYVIYEKPKKVELNILYENDKFIVYKI